jgi:hypothetical protein
MTNHLRTIARALGGEVSGSRILAPGPGHSPRDRSMQVTLDAEGDFLVHSFAGDHWKDCRDYVRDRLGLQQERRAVARSRRKSCDGSERERSQQSAERIWRETIAITGTAGEAYLAARGIDLDAVPEHGGLRWHPRCPWGRGNAPCIVARFTDPLTAAPRGIHRRPINGEKPKAIGLMRGNVIRLWPDADVSTGLVIGEGIETVLAAATRISHRGTLLRPAWACASADNLANFPVLAGIEALTILVDHDVKGAGQRAAEQCARRWCEAGREVTRLQPLDLGTDFNDLVRP